VAPLGPHASRRASALTVPATIGDLELLGASSGSFLRICLASDTLLAERPPAAPPTTTDDVLAVARRAQLLGTVALIASLAAFAVAIAL